MDSYMYKLILICCPPCGKKILQTVWLVRNVFQIIFQELGIDFSISFFCLDLFNLHREWYTFEKWLLSVSLEQGTDFKELVSINFWLYRLGRGLMWLTERREIAWENSVCLGKCLDPFWIAVTWAGYAHTYGVIHQLMELTISCPGKKCMLKSKAFWWN